MTVTQNFPVTGLTCAHCVTAVTEEVGAVPGVSGVAVELHPEGVSTLTVTCQSALTDEQVADALDEAGDYHLAVAR